jgi:hypothetical protein
VFLGNSELCWVVAGLSRLIYDVVNGPAFCSTLVGAELEVVAPNMAVSYDGGAAYLSAMQFASYRITYPLLAFNHLLRSVPLPLKLLLVQLSPFSILNL